MAKDLPPDPGCNEDKLERLLNCPAFTLSTLLEMKPCPEFIREFQEAHAAESLEVAFERHRFEQETIICTLLEQTDDLEKVDSAGWTRLYRAAWYGNDQALTALLKHGVNPYARAKDGTTTLHAVCWHSGPSLLRFEHESKMIENPRVVIINQLIDAGIDMNVQDEGGSTPLHVAVNCGAFEASSDGGNPLAVWALLKRDADPNIPNRQGKTPLILAADCCYLGETILECIQLLLKAGAEQ